MDNPTPMLRQYLEIKKLYPGTLLFFRLGDFYELFNDDAIVGARELQITLTARQKDSKNPIPMCGVPHHAASTYIAKLVRRGYRVAVCDQAEAAGKGVKLVKREVVRVITPGTAIDEQLLESGEQVFLASVSANGESVGAAFLELSTGEFTATEVTGPGGWQKVRDSIERYSPREILVAPDLQRIAGQNLGLDSNGDQALFDNGPELPERSLMTVVDQEYFDGASADEILKKHFNVAELSGYGIDQKAEAIRAAGACLRYVIETQKSSSAHISSISCFDQSEFLVLDRLTLANLEVVGSRNELSKRTLFSVINEAVTGMGTRLLRSWLLRPSIKRSEIQTRQTAVAELTDSIIREKTRFLLKQVADLERLVGRLNLGNLLPRDLIALRGTLEQAPQINAVISDARSLLLQVLSENIFELPEVCDLISRSIIDEPPAGFAEGGVIRDGFHAELDDLRTISRSGKTAIAAFEEQERSRSGIPTLKVRFNNVFGYYIEVSKANLTKVPEDYERRQTLANAERFTTAQLKAWEQKVLGAEEKILELEAEIFQSIRESVRAETQRLQSTARALATLDALCSLAETATKRNYIAPVLHDGDEIEIKAGRHPIVEAYLKDSFVPNDIYLNNSTDRLLIITGANMGGKSTVLRQIALIQILAQIGSFVPASSARLPIVDRIWTRVGASDDLASGRSTFMVEMTETASILHNATPRSLVLLDEIGRGTSTFDGMSIAWAVAEYLHNSSEHSAKTMFATHYHELTELAENLAGAKNYQLAASEKDGDVVFLHKLQPGKSSKSYGIAVARLAGLPQPVIERAKDVLEKLEKYELAVFKDGKQTGIGAAAGRDMAAQFSLFAISNESAIDELRAVDVDRLSPEETVSMLKHLKQRII
jgi:DNA mismatch repair protein MutS